jgi:hypothetical protein
MPESYDGNAAQTRIVAEQIADTAITRFSANQADVRSKLTLTEIGVIVSLLSSAALAVFTLGVVYAQVQSTTQRVAKVEDKSDRMATDLAEIKANVEFLAELAHEQREHK